MVKDLSLQLAIRLILNIRMSITLQSWQITENIFALDYEVLMPSGYSIFKTRDLRQETSGLVAAGIFVAIHFGQLLVNKLLLPVMKFVFPSLICWASAFLSDRFVFLLLEVRFSLMREMHGTENGSGMTKACLEVLESV